MRYPKKVELNTNEAASENMAESFRTFKMHLLREILLGVFPVKISVLNYAAAGWWKKCISRC